MNQQDKTGRRIVVGVDGSPSSKGALQWAVAQAERTGATVRAVSAWHHPVLSSGYANAWAPVAAPVKDFQEIAAKALADAIADAVDPASPAQIATCVREGNPVQALLAEADGAELLVVGSRGHGGFTGALLGSVSQHCAQHSPCPVVIIRGHAAT